MKQYFRKNIVPICIQALFIVSCFVLPKEWLIYSNFIFYAALLIYFVAKRDLDFREWIANLRSGKKFWLCTILTGLLFAAAFAVTSVLESCFPQFSAGMIMLKTDSIGKLVLFTFSTVLFPAVTEETFYRKNLISFSSNAVMVVTTIFSMFLYAIEHALSIWGILLAMIWALPMCLSYIKTKNIYVPMTAHFIGNLIGNGIDIVFILFSLL